jgi:general secretion pathway protein G
MDANEPLRIDPSVWPKGFRLGRGMAFVAGCAFGGLGGLVAGFVVLPNVLQFLVPARSKAEVDIFRIERALADYALANECRYPPGLGALVVPDVNGQRFLAAAELPRDPWGHEYQYAAPAKDHPRPRVFSLGRDGAIGGRGDDADIELDRKIP